MSMFSIAVSGGIAGMLVDILLFRIDTHKTRKQSNKKLRIKSRMVSPYSGLLITVIGSAPDSTYYMVAYESLKKKMQNIFPESYNPMIYVCSAAFAEITACIIRVPVETIKQKMQLGLYKTNISAIKSITARYGYRALYDGYFPTVMREIPFGAIQFLLYESLKKHFYTNKNREITTTGTITLGAAAGGFAGLASNPIDVAKTRIMTVSGEKTYWETPGVFRTLKGMVQKEGWKVLMSGSVERVAWVSIGGAVFFCIYQFLREGLDDVKFEHRIGK